MLGVLSLIIGLYMLRHILITIVALALLLGIFWVINGTIYLFTAIMMLISVASQTRSLARRA